MRGIVLFLVVAWAGTIVLVLGQAFWHWLEQFDDYDDERKS